MQLVKIFKKDVDRAIEGVIKADDNSGLHNEIEEYVLTKEVGLGSRYVQNTPMQINVR